MKVILLILFLSITNAEIAEISKYSTTYLRTLEDVRDLTYKPDWKDLDSRPLPQWYDYAKIGIFIHWGVFSVPSFGSEWFWKYLYDSDTKYVSFMKKNYPPGFTYQDFGPMLTAEFFEPDQWADLFVKSGAKYVVLTSKHHEGYTLFPSRRSFSWNSVDVGPKRDLVKELAAAVRNKKLKFGLYHSLFEWYNPMYLEDKENSFNTRFFSDTKLWPDVKQLVNDYKPSVLWADGDWEAYDTYWNSTGLLAWLYNESPVKDEIVVNDRWGIGTGCVHGDFYNCQDRYNPGKLQKHKWENAFTIDSQSWGYRRNIDISEILTTKQILKEVVTTVSCGGNALINIGPTKEGTIAPIFQERLLDLGQWLEINGEAIYGTSPFVHQNDTGNNNVWYTCTKKQYNSLNPTAPPNPADNVTAIYAIVLKWPDTDNNMLIINDITAFIYREMYNLVLLGNENTYISWNIYKGQTLIMLPNKDTLASQNAWTLKFFKK